MAPSEKQPATAPARGERIAKVLSRRGIASRREAERLIELGEVTVNGKVITSPALNVTAGDRITVSGRPLPPEEPARLWLYYKPEGLVTSAADEKGRDTVFDHLPRDMPRVMSVGRLDLNSEGLLLLTNDGELKRRLELPSTGWLRKYRVRVRGNPTDDQLEPLRRGITIEGERFQPMQVTLDRLQGANAWLTAGLREGRNREVRRAMEAIGLFVNRLIRVSYGPFRLGELRPGEVEEVRPRVLREQLGEAAAEGAAAGKDTTARPARKLAPRRRAEDTSGAPAEAPGDKPRRPAPRREGDPPRATRPGAGVKALARAWKAAVPDDRPAGKPPQPPAKPGAGSAPRKGTGTARPAAEKAGTGGKGAARDTRPGRGGGAPPPAAPAGRPAPRPPSRRPPGPSAPRGPRRGK